MAAKSNNMPSGVNATGLPPRIPNRFCIEAEFLLLMDLKRRAEQRLDALVEILDPGVEQLPLSGLQQAAPDVLLFKGGRNAS